MTDVTHLIERFHAAVASLPAPGGGGCHAALLGAASKGVFAGLPDCEIHAAIRAGVPPGGRQVTDTEISAAIRRARADVRPADTTAPYAPRRRPVKAPEIDYGRARACLIAKGGGAIDPDDAGLWESSPIRLDWPNGLGDTIAFLAAAYSPEEHVYIGPQFGASRDNVRQVADWREFFRLKQIELGALPEDRRRQAEIELATLYPHFVANPLTGEVGLTKDGNPSYRADSCVSAFRWVVAEFDTIGKPEQIAFFKGFGWPCTALIDTGGKSIHALLRVDARDVAEWNRLVENRMFNLLGGLGVDHACKNESRMSRLPGVRRLKSNADGSVYDSGKFQRLLWFTSGAEVIR